MRRVVSTIVSIWLVSALAMCGGSFSLNDESADGHDANTSDPDGGAIDATEPSDTASSLDAADASGDDGFEPRDSAEPHDASGDRGKNDDGGVDDGGGAEDGSLHDGGEAHDAGNLHDASASHDASGLHDATTADAKALTSGTCPLQCEPSVYVGGLSVCVPEAVTCPATESGAMGN
jgi:hypothetical protein